MSNLNELLSGQNIRIDNHHRGVPMKWDWKPGEQPDDIHLDKEMNRSVKGKKVQIRVTLNKDGGVNVPHAKNKKDQAWMNEYNRIKEEVREVLEHDSALTKEFVRTVKKAIQDIGPKKDRRAVRMALERIGKFFGLNAFPIQQMINEANGLFILYSHPQHLQYYIAFDVDYAFYLGEGGVRDFYRHSRVTKLWRKMCKDLERCPSLQDLVNYYLEGRTKQVSNLFQNIDGNKKGSLELKELLENKGIFDNPKPVQFIKILLQISVDNDDTILDFFSGSSSTAHAVMQLNAEDGGNRKFIMVQLPEECTEKSEAFKAGYKNICEIGKERIRRAGDKIVEENKDKDGIEDLDIGFKVIKIK